MSKKILVIGGGPAGYPAALKAATLGAEVTVVEKSAIGGVCLNCGCIPSKSLLDAAHRFDVVKKIGLLSQEDITQPVPSWQKIIERRGNVITKLQGGIAGMFKAKKVNLINGTASFVDKNTVSVETEQDVQTITFDAVIIATGTEAFIPPPFNAHKDKIYDNSNIFKMPALPATITIIGGGVIGCEFACIFNALGVKVNIVEMLPAILPGTDDASVRTLNTSFAKRGINIMTGKKAVDFKVEGNSKKIIFEDGGELASDEVLVAVGRAVDASSLKLENIGVCWDRKGIKVNPKTMEVAPGIYAAGDINGIHLLAHAATAQGEVAAVNACGENKEYDDTLIPHAMYTWPEVASVGLNSAQAAEAGYKAKVQRAYFMANGRALTQDSAEGQIQIVSNEENGVILGAQIAGPDASEMIHIFSVVLHAKMTTAQLKEIVWAHPSLSEIIHEALAK
ncbi:dihydrolipoamide dehydrogenase [Elusimicrobium posterum]|uniref:dihydrolipoyl dehydrogenase n=1 Tax=Elusimicrobium posterum TaxID=3116653 RepID=UPI003C740369